MRLDTGSRMPVKFSLTPVAIRVSKKLPSTRQHDDVPDDRVPTRLSLTQRQWEDLR